MRNYQTCQEPECVSYCRRGKHFCDRHNDEGLIRECMVHAQTVRTQEEDMPFRKLLRHIRLSFPNAPRWNMIEPSISDQGIQTKTRSGPTYGGPLQDYWPTMLGIPRRELP